MHQKKLVLNILYCLLLFVKQQIIFSWRLKISIPFHYIGNMKLLSCSLFFCQTEELFLEGNKLAMDHYYIQVFLHNPILDSHLVIHFVERIRNHYNVVHLLILLMRNEDVQRVVVSKWKKKTIIITIIIKGNNII